jgi:flagellar hook-associated protein 1 FlgK
MVSLNGLLGVAGEAMAAHSAALSVTGQNIANVDTPGYVRRGVVLETRPGGGGVGLMGISRAFDRFATGRVVGEGALQSAADARSKALSTLESALAPAGSPTIGDRMQSLFDSFTRLAQSPNDATVRAQALGAASDLVDGFHTAATALVSQRADLRQQAAATAGEVNERLARIADLNAKIATATAAGQGGESLRDERDQLVREVGDRVGAKAIEDSMGRVTLLSAGSTLVEADHASKLSVGETKDGNLKIEVHHADGGVVDVTQNVTAGTLGGLREARDVDIPDLQSRLDQMASDVANGLNAVHQKGYGLDGVAGRNLFTPPAKVPGAAYALTLDAAVAGNPSALGAAKAAADLPGGNDVALELAGLANQPLGQAATPASAWGDLTGALGTKKASSDAELALRKDTVAQAETLRDSASGVSIDEEMVNLTKFQRAFQASVKVLQTVDELLAGLLRGA